MKQETRNLGGRPEWCSKFWTLELVESQAHFSAISTSFILRCFLHSFHIFSPRGLCPLIRFPLELYAYKPATRGLLPDFLGLDLFLLPCVTQREFSPYFFWKESAKWRNTDLLSRTDEGCRGRGSRGWCVSVDWHIPQCGLSSLYPSLPSDFSPALLPGTVSRLDELSEACGWKPCPLRRPEPKFVYFSSRAFAQWQPPTCACSESSCRVIRSSCWEAHNFWAFWSGRSNSERKTQDPNSLCDIIKLSLHIFLSSFYLLSGNENLLT